MQYISVKNWDSKQHYKHRNPPWIKLHCDLLNDYEFARLKDANKSHLMLIWLLASRLDNKIPNDPKWIAKRIGSTTTIDINMLIDRVFLVTDSNVQAECKQSAMPETETETETEPWSNDFDRFWEAYPKKVKKKPAAAIWKKKKPDVEVLIADIQERLARDSQWQTKEFIPNPTTYLNDEGWNDEICIRSSSKPGNGITQTPLDRHHEAVRELEQQSNDEIVG